MTTTKKRDYYEILGVSRDADDAEIRRAYRARAREDRPDVAEAYATLSNRERRLLYDRFGFRGSGLAVEPADFGDQEGGSGADVVTELDLGHYEAQRGTARRVRIDGEGLCPRCGGEGGETDVCGECDGTGSVPTASGRDAGRLLQLESCSVCAGTGRLLVDRCGECGGRGRLDVTRTVRVQIPAGAEDGQVVRVAGEGNPRSDGGDRGDAFLVLRVADPPPRRPAVKYAALLLLLTALVVLAYLIVH
jgi:molecular chaperone DnaJ